jgi:ubiquitin-activating enzyme E1
MDLETVRHFQIIGDANISEKEISFINLNGIAFETIKNLILMGFKKFNIYENNDKINERDIEEIFILNITHLSGKKSEILFKYFKELKEDIQINFYKYEKVFETNPNIIIFTEENILSEKSIKINNYCHKNNIKYIAVQNIGLLLNVFVDFGKKEEYQFLTGDIETDFPRTYIIKKQFKDNEIHFYTEKEVGLFNKESTVKYKNQNGEILFKIKDLEKNIIKVYAEEEIYEKIEADKESILESVSLTTLEFEFQTIEELFYNPKLHLNDEWEDYGQQKKLILFHLNKLIDKINEKNYVELMKDVLDEECKEYFLEQYHNTILTLIKSFKGLAPPLITSISSICSHMVLVGCLNRFTPINQFLFLEFTEFLPNIEVKISENETNRQRLLFGDDVMDYLEKIKIFQIGCGATGNESSKIFKLMGIGSKDGELILADGDNFATSNQNRQFFCTANDNNKPKSQVIKEKLKEYSNDKMKITAYTKHVDDENYKEYNNKFFENIDVMFSMVDSAIVRNYLSKICDFNDVSMFDCGTKILKASSTMFMPEIFQYYIYDNVMEENNSCSAKQFPTKQEQIVKFFSKEAFEKYFDKMINQKIYCINSKINESEVIKLIKNDDYDLYFDYFYNQEYKEYFENILSLDTNEEGFWHGKKKPKIIEFDMNDKNHQDLYHSFIRIMKKSYVNDEFINQEYDKDNFDHLDFIIQFTKLKCISFDIFFDLDKDYLKIQKIISNVTPSIVTSSAFISSINTMRLYLFAFYKLKLIEKDELINNTKEYKINLSLLSFEKESNPIYEKIKSNFYHEYKINEKTTINQIKKNFYDIFKDQYDDSRIYKYTLIKVDDQIKLENSLDKKFIFDFIDQSEKYSRIKVNFPDHHFVYIKIFI